MKTSDNRDLPEEIKGWILGIAFFALGIILILSFWNLSGKVGEILFSFFRLLFGWLSFASFLPFFYLGWLLIESRKEKIPPYKYWALVILVLSLTSILHLPFVDNEVVLEQGRGGGYVGYALSFILKEFFGFWASLVIFLSLLAISLILLFDLFSKKGKPTFGKKGEEELEKFKTKEKSEEENPAKPEKIKLEKGILFFRKKKTLFKSKSIKSFGKEKFPLDLLDKGLMEPQSGDIKNNKLIIHKTLESFSIPVEMGEVKVGPTVTQYTLKPFQGIKLSQITTLSNDLSLALAAHPIRIEAPIPGESLVGVEVPNKKRAIVRLREILESEKFKTQSSNLTIPFGFAVSGEVFLADLGRMPHLLVAGATGSGKTIFLNSLILSLIYQNSPIDLRFILIDPKRVELSLYEDLPHLLAPVVTSVEKTINVLKWSILEMTKRFDLFLEKKKRDILSYNQDAEEKLPYIVIVIDELADLMVASPQEIETCIIRLAQMARATGIHLVMATQRPSVDIITGLIKANITNRVAFSVASAIDSRTILDFSGAEKLLGMGDMLFVSPEISRPKRLQGPLISEKEIKRVVNYLKNIFPLDYEEEVTEPPKEEIKGLEFEMGGDELLPQAEEIVTRARKASASLLQRRMRVGYARAARLLDLLEEKGVIGPADGAKPRIVYETGESLELKEDENQ